MEVGQPHSSAFVWAMFGGRSGQAKPKHPLVCMRARMGCGPCLAGLGCNTHQQELGLWVSHGQARLKHPPAHTRRGACNEPSRGTLGYPYKAVASTGEYESLGWGWSGLGKAVVPKLENHYKTTETLKERAKYNFSICT